MEQPFSKRQPAGIPVKAHKWLIIAVLCAVGLMCYGCSAGCATIQYHLHYKQMIEKDQIERLIRIEQKLDTLLTHP